SRGGATVHAAYQSNERVDAIGARTKIGLTYNQMMALALTATFDPPRVTAGEPQDLTMRLTLTNNGPQSLPLYVGMAQFDFIGGWGSPIWVFGAKPDSGVHFLSFSTYHGPPGMPPSADVFEARRTSLASRASETREIPGCFIPPNLL